MLAALLWLYARPVAGISRILDRGRLWIALFLALAVSLFLHIPQIPVSYPVTEGPGIYYPPPDTTPIIAAAAIRWLGAGHSSFLTPIGALIFAFVPAIIFTRAVSGFGSFGV